MCLVTSPSANAIVHPEGEAQGQDDHEVVEGCKAAADGLGCILAEVLGSELRLSSVSVIILGVENERLITDHGGGTNGKT